MAELGLLLVALAGSGFMALALLREEWPPRWKFTLGPGRVASGGREVAGEVRVE